MAVLSFGGWEADEGGDIAIIWVLGVDMVFVRILDFWFFGMA